jgi:hypothetical protein
MTALAGWENFYVIVGSSAGALIGLQFVVITLIADTPIARADAQAGGAFSTPSVVHFGAVLFLSAIVSAPWGGLTPVAVLWGLLGLFGIAYSVSLPGECEPRLPTGQCARIGCFMLCYHLLHTWRLPYRPAAKSHARLALFVIAAAALLLLFIGIHNAWDAVTYHVFVRRQEQRETEQASKPKE